MKICRFTSLVTNASLTYIILVERPQYLKLTNIFVQSFNFIDDPYHPSVEFMLYEQPWRMPLSEFCSALGVRNTGLTGKIMCSPSTSRSSMPESVMMIGGILRMQNLGAFNFQL